MSAAIPRLEYDELEPALAQALAPRVERLGYLGEFFKCTAHQPAALLAFMEFTAASKQGLPARLVELVALTVAVVTGNAYERNQHERLSLRLGFGRDWVAAVERLDPDPDEDARNEGAGLDQAERSVQRLVIAMIRRHGRDVEAELAAVVAAIGHAGAVAVMMVVGRYVTHALIVNALAPPVPSVFEDGFQG